MDKRRYLGILGLAVSLVHHSDALSDDPELLAGLEENLENIAAMTGFDLQIEEDPRALDELVEAVS